MGGLITFFLIIYFVARASGSKPASGISGDRHSKLWLAFAPVWFVLFIGWAYAGAYVPHGEIWFSALGTVLFVPSFYSYLTARLGWVRVSYWLGHISFAIFRRSPSAGAIWRGLQATCRLPDPESKREALQWLKQRFLQQKGDVYSGEMVLFVIIDAFLQRPNDKHFMAEQLGLLRGIGMASVPGPVRRYATKLALAPALADEDHERIQQTAEMWDKLFTSPVTSFLLEFYAHLEGKSWATRYGLWWRGLRIWRYPTLRAFPEKYLSTPAATEPLANKDRKTDMSMAWLADASTFGELNARLTDEGQEAKWKARAKELGVWRIDDAWRSITRSVDKAFATDSPHVASFDPEAERNFVSTQYLCQSVARRLYEGQPSHGPQDFLEWFRLRQLLHAMRDHEDILNASFSSNHQIIWNWIADLWNNKKYRCLVHFMAGACQPLARRNGHQQLAEMLTGLTVGHYR